ncbi:MAG: hypothetical protein ACK5L3_07230, partial [Oscillospiraceae bacterium]
MKRMAVFILLFSAIAGFSSCAVNQIPSLTNSVFSTPSSATGLETSEPSSPGAVVASSSQQGGLMLYETLEAAPFDLSISEDKYSLSIQGEKGQLVLPSFFEYRDGQFITDGYVFIFPVYNRAGLYAVEEGEVPKSIAQTDDYQWRLDTPDHSNEETWLPGE